MKHLALVLVAAVAGGCASAPPPASTDTLVITGGTVVTMDTNWRVIPDGAVAIVGPTIAAVGSATEVAAAYPAARIIDAGGTIVMPGLVNTHGHAPMVLFRGLADDLALMGWLQQHIFPAEARFVDEDFVRLGTQLACLEMLRGGTTTFVDMYYFEDAIAEEVERCGMRGILGQTLIDFPAPDFRTWEAATAGAREFAKRWKNHPRVRPAIAPHAVYTVSDPHLREAHALAAEYDLPLLIHLVEDRGELERAQQRSGKTSIAVLDDLGLLDERVVAAHVVWPSSQEIPLLADRGVGVAHCPQSNMKLAAGIAPVPALLAAGVDVGLGTDGAASNNDLDLWEELDTAAKLHKVATGDPTTLPARDVVAMATIGGARALDLDASIGSLEVGKRADLIIVRTDGLQQAPQRPDPNPYSLLVYATKAGDVDTVIIDGQVVMQKGRIATLDERAILTAARTLRERIQAQASATQP